MCIRDRDYMGEHGYSSIGLVIGGTHIEEATEIYTLSLHDALPI